MTLASFGGKDLIVQETHCLPPVSNPPKKSCSTLTKQHVEIWTATV